MQKNMQQSGVGDALGGGSVAVRCSSRGCAMPFGPGNDTLYDNEPIELRNTTFQLHENSGFITPRDFFTSDCPHGPSEVTIF